MVVLWIPIVVTVVLLANGVACDAYGAKNTLGLIKIALKEK